MLLINLYMYVLRILNFQPMCVLGLTALMRVLFFWGRECEEYDVQCVPALKVDIRVCLGCFLIDACTVRARFFGTI